MLIEAKALCVSLGGRSLLDQIDLSLCRGEIVTIIGPNGAGKSTLVKAMLGVHKKYSGTVTKKKDLKIGYVPQQFAVDSLVPLTVERLICLTRDVPVAQIDALLEETGISGLKTREVSALSGGELRRVLLARALALEPDLLVLDEPVQGVDFSGEIKLYELIASIRDQRGCGVLMVSHDLHVVMADSDRVICLNRHICCEGQPEAVQSHPEFARLFGPTAAAIGFYQHAHDHDHNHDTSGGTEHSDHSNRDGKSQYEVSPRG